MARSSTTFGSPGRPSRGRPKGSIGKQNRALAPIARGLFDEFAEIHFRRLFSGELEKGGQVEIEVGENGEIVSVRNIRNGKASPTVMHLRTDALEFLCERGWGKAPQKIVLEGEGEETPDDILRRLMKQRNDKLARGGAAADEKGGDGGEREHP